MVEGRLALKPDQKVYAVGHDFSYTQMSSISAICLASALPDTQASTSLKMALSLEHLTWDCHYFQSEFIFTHCSSESLCQMATQKEQTGSPPLVSYLCYLWLRGP